MPLREGSLLARWHSRARDVFDQGMLLHGSKIMVLVSCFTVDWGVLRVVLITSSLMSMAFHGLFPAPRPVRMAWGLIFALGHMYSLALYLRETYDWQLNEHDQEVYKEIFEPHGFTKWHFLKLLEKGEYRTYKPGEVINEECEPMEYISVLLRGEAEFSWRKREDMDGESSAKLKERDRGKWDQVPAHTSGLIVAPALAGEIWDREFYSEPTMAKLEKLHGKREHIWTYGLTAANEVEVLRFPTRWLHEYLQDDDRVRAAAVELQVADLWQARRRLFTKFELTKQHATTLELETDELRNVIQLMVPLAGELPIPNEIATRLGLSHLQGRRTNASQPQRSTGNRVARQRTRERAQGITVPADAMTLFSRKELQDLKQTFAKVDADGSGAIDADELSTLLRKLNKVVTRDTLLRLIAEVDEDGNHEIDFEEFLHFMDKMRQQDADDNEMIDIVQKAQNMYKQEDSHVRRRSQSGKLPQRHPSWGPVAEGGISVSQTDSHKK